MSRAWIIIGFPFLMLVTMITVQSIYRRRSMAQDLAEADERERIQNATHDRIMSRLSALALAGEVEKMTGEKLPSLRSMPDALREVARDLRDIVSKRDLAERTVDLNSTVEHVCASRSEQYGMPIEFQSDVDGPLVLAAQPAQEVLAVLEEAIGNSMKHAGGTKVQVSLSGTDITHSLVISDDGAGFDAELNLASDGGSYSGLGLKSLRTRAQRLGGQMNIKSELGSGTIIALTWKS